MDHIAPDGHRTECTRERFRCRLCELLDRDGPDFSVGYRCRYFPAECPDRPAVSTYIRDPALPLPMVPPPPAPAIPLAGDLVAAMTERLGADRFAKWVAAKVGVDCGCARRRELLNRVDATARRYLGWL